MKARIQYRTGAICLRLLDYGESDKIVTFCTEEFGKVRGIAKGAKRSRRRFANALEPFSRSELLFSRRGSEGLALIEASDVTCHFPLIRADLEKTLIASYFIDLADHFLPEDKKNAPLFGLLNDFLKLLEARPAEEALLRFFEIRLLMLSGYDPALDHCLTCKTPLGNRSLYRFTPAAGGITCDACPPRGPEGIPVSVGTLRTLLLCRELPIDRLNRLLLTEQSAAESRRLLSHFIRHLLGRELKSLQVLNDIRRLVT